MYTNRIDVLALINFSHDYIITFIFSLWSKTFSFQPNMYEEFHNRTHFEIPMQTVQFYYAPIGKKITF